MAVSSHRALVIPVRRDESVSDPLEILEKREFNDRFIRDCTNLPEIQRKVMLLRYGSSSMTQFEVARVVGKSRQAVQRIEYSAKAIIRQDSVLMNSYDVA